MRYVVKALMLALVAGWTSCVTVAPASARERVDAAAQSALMQSLRARPDVAAAIDAAMHVRSFPIRRPF